MVERTVLCIRDGPLEHEVAVNIVEDYWGSLATLLIVLPIFLGAWWTVHKLASSLALKPECCQSKNSSCTRCSHAGVSKPRGGSETYVLQ